LERAMNKEQYNKFFNSLNTRIEILERRVEETTSLPQAHFVAKVRLQEARDCLGNLVDIMGDEL
jgi:hypothetical protein